MNSQTRKDKMSRNYYLFLLSSLFIVACNSKHTDANAHKFEIHFGNSQNAPFKLSQIIDTVEYIDIKSQIPIGNIDEIKYTDSTFFMCDKNAGKIYILNNKGELTKELSYKGHAANEYIQINDFEVSPYDGNITIYDGASQKFNVYDKQYVYRYSFKVHDVIRDFAKMENGDYVMYTPDYNKDSKRGLWITDSVGAFKKQLVSISDDFLYGGIYPNYLVRINHTNFGLMGGEDKDNIYKISIDGADIAYHIDFDISIPNKLKKKEIINYNNYKGEIYTKNSYFETDRWIFFSATDFENNTLFFYDKTNDKHYALSKQEDLIEDVDLFGAFTHVSGNYIINILYPNMIIPYSTLRKKFPYITTESNPIIVIARLKT